MTIILINYKSDHSICDDYGIDANGIWMDGDKSYKPVYGTITGGAKAKTNSLSDILTQWKSLILTFLIINLLKRGVNLYGNMLAYFLILKFKKN